MYSTEYQVYSKTPNVQTNYLLVLVPNSAMEVQVIHTSHKISTHNYNACLFTKIEKIISFLYLRKQRVVFHIREPDLPVEEELRNRKLFDQF